MARKYRIEENVEVVDAGVKGTMVGKKDGWVYLLKDVVPGDVVDVKARKKKKSFFEGRPVAFKKYSEHRVTPFCKHFSDCGGCQWQNIHYNKQIALKQKTVKDCFFRLATEADAPDPLPIIHAPATRYYRNKLDFSAAPERWFTQEEVDSGDTLSISPALGFHVPGRFDKVLDIEECHLQPEPSNKIRNSLKSYVANQGLSFYDTVNHKGFLRSLILRNSIDNKFMVILVVGQDNRDGIEGCLNHLKENFPEIDSIYYVVNTKQNDSVHDLPHHHYAGNMYLEDQAGHIKFLLGPASFYQTNGQHTETLYSVVRDFAELNGAEHLLDLYCGVGTIGLFLGDQCATLTGIEVVEEAVQLARENAIKNGINNANFYTGDAGDVLTNAFADNLNKPDVVVTDPPRAGMHKKVVSYLLDLNPGKIVYVSCNPATQARDIELLAEQYKIEKLQPVDMFPHTHHVENVALLKRKA